MAAMIKHFLKEEGIKISLSNLCKVLKIGSSGVSKASKILKKIEIERKHLFNMIKKIITQIKIIIFLFY